MRLYRSPPPGLAALVRTTGRFRSLFLRLALLVVLYPLAPESTYAARGGHSGGTQSSTVSSSYQLIEEQSAGFETPDSEQVVNWWGGWGDWFNVDRFRWFYADDLKTQLTIGFGFPIAGQTFDQVSVLVNGLLQFDGEDGRLEREYNNSRLPSNAGDLLLAVYWDDLLIDWQAEVTYGISGNAPNRRFIVTWRNVRAYRGNRRYDFQVVLHEQGDILYRYGRGGTNGVSATIGLEISDTDYVQHSFNQNSVSHQQDLRFQPEEQDLPEPIAAYSFEDGGISGEDDELKDASSNGLHGRGISSDPEEPIVISQDHPALDSDPGTCGYAVLNGDGQYFEVADHALLDMSEQFTAAAWVKLDEIPNRDLKTILSKDTNYEFHINSRGQVFWWWRTDRNATRSLTGAQTLETDRWYHIAVTYESGRQVIYVDGTAVASSSWEEGLKNNSNPLQIGADQGIGSRQLHGQIDEIRIYDQALSQLHIDELRSATHPCETSCALAGFSISQPPYGLACPFSRAAIEVAALCEGGAVKTDYQGTLLVSTNENTMSTFYRSADAAASINQLSFDGSESGQASLYLHHANEKAGLLVSVQDQATGIVTQSESATDVRPSGLLLSQPQDFVCGGTTQMSLTAIGQNDAGQGCTRLSGFDGEKHLKAWFTAQLAPDGPEVTTHSPLIINGQSIAEHEQPSDNNLSLVFDEGMAELELGYFNAAKLSQIQLRYDQGPHDGQTSEAVSVGIGPLQGAASGVLVKPHRLSLTLDEAANCATQGANCTPFVAAGARFELGLEAQCLDGSTATDFIGEVELSSQVIAPAGGQQATLALSSVDLSQQDNGERQVQQSLSEVGVHQLEASTRYFGEALEPAEQILGRFYPARYRLVSSFLNQSCGNFTYMGQPGLALSFTLQAENDEGDRTLNYQGAFAKSLVDWIAEDDDRGVNLSARLEAGHSPGWNQGQMTDALSLTFARSSEPDGPYPELVLGLRLDDQDAPLTPLLGTNINPDNSGNCEAAGGCTGVSLGQADLRFGYLMLDNAYGPETAALQQRIASWYFDGSGWRMNQDDQCTSLEASSLTDLDWTDELNAGETTAQFVGSVNQLSQGQLLIEHSAPGIGNQGSVRYQYPAPSWLKMDTDGDGDYQEDSQGQVIFGQYRGTDRMIFWRESLGR